MANIRLRNLSARELVAVAGTEPFTVPQIVAKCKAKYGPYTCHIDFNVVHFMLKSMEKSPNVVLEVTGRPRDRQYRIVSITEKYFTFSETFQRDRRTPGRKPYSELVPRDGDERESAAFLARVAHINRLWEPARQAKDIA